MIIPIKQLILEINNPLSNVGFPVTQPMHATKQKMTEPEQSKGIPPENNGSLTAAKTKSTGIKQPGKLTENLIRDAQKITLKQQG